MLVIESEFRAIARYIVFMQMAEKLAKLSPDPKRQVGALLVRKDFKNIISIGINGTIPGHPNERLSMETGRSGFRHAERNCLVLAQNVPDVKDYMLFCTLSPCVECSGDIAVFGIDTVFYKDEYKSELQAGLNTMRTSGIKVMSIWEKLEGMFRDLVHFELIGFRAGFESSALTDEGVRILTKRHLEKFGMPFDDSLDFHDSWKYDYPKYFIRYLYSLV